MNEYGTKLNKKQVHDFFDPSDTYISDYDDKDKGISMPYTYYEVMVSHWG